MLYDGSVIAKETNVISIADSEETLMLEEESRSKMLFKNNFPVTNFNLFTNHIASRLVKTEAPMELPKVSLVNTSLKKLKYHLGQFDNVVKKQITLDALTEGEWGKFKGKDIVDNAAQVSNATTIAPGMYKLDLVTLAPKDKNNRETHIYYLKHTMEQAAILREIVGNKEILALDIHKPSEKLVVVTPINKKKIVRHELCFLEFVSDMNASSKSKTVKKAKKKEEWKHTGKVKFVRSKDEAPDAIIKCIKNIQVHLNATVWNIQIDNGTEIVNQTLREFYKNVGISHQTSVARTPQQNDIVERRNRTLVEAARTMLIFLKAPLFCGPKQSIQLVIHKTVP
ncbi:retrovirus-related pol polyprotein from transposon TNT 1-94 [Tanacetum coccineum]